MGFKSPIEPWIKSSHVLVASSKGDGFGRTIIEAMNLQVPVIASNFGGHKEIIKHNYNGLISKNRSADEVVKCILEFFEVGSKTIFLLNTMILTDVTLWKNDMLEELIGKFTDFIE